MNYNITVDDMTDNTVKVEILSTPKKSLFLTKTQAGAYLYWIAESLVENKYDPVKLKYDNATITIDYRTASNFYFALLEWSEQFHDNIVNKLDAELEQIENGTIQPNDYIDFSELDDIISCKHSFN